MRKNNFNRFMEIEQQVFHTFKLKDLLQVIVGATILAIPIGFTQETWELGLHLPGTHIFGFMALSLTFISLFTYNYYHKNNLKAHAEHFFQRVIFTYLFSFIVVALILTLITKAPWTTDFLLAIKRTVLVTFPASMSATLTDSL